MENIIKNDSEYDTCIRRVIDNLKNQSPNNSFIKLVLEEDDFGYKVKCKIVSKLETFSDEVVTNSFAEALVIIESKMIKQLNDWKCRRDFNVYLNQQNRA